MLAYIASEELSARIVNDRLSFISFYFSHYLFYIWFYFTFLILNLGEKCDMMSCVTYVTVTVTQSCNTREEHRRF